LNLLRMSATSVEYRYGIAPSISNAYA